MHRRSCIKSAPLSMEGDENIENLLKTSVNILLRNLLAYSEVKSDILRPLKKPGESKNA